MRRTSFVLLLSTILIAVSLVTLSYCRKEDALVAGKKRVRLQLQWFDQAQFIGFYVALGKNFYADEGLVVEINPGAFNLDPIQRVVNGNAEIGLATGDQLLIAEASERPVRAIGTVFTKSVACFMAKAESGISSPKDFVGRKVGVFRGFDTENVLLSILARQNIDPKSVQIVDAGALAAFENGELEVFPSYVFNEPLQMARANIKTTIVRPDDFGVRFYSDTLFTTDEYLAANRAVVVRFLRASARGWEYAQRHPDEALDLMYRQVRNLSRASTYAHQQDMLNVVLQHVQPDGRRTFVMDRQRWEDMESALRTTGKLRTPGHVADLCDFQLADEASR